MNVSDMGNSTEGFAKLAAIYEKQHQDQSTIILTGAGFDFRSAQNQTMVDQALDNLCALCTSTDLAPSDSVALQFGQQCASLDKLFTNIQAADLQAISLRATLSQPKLKGAADKLKAVDSELTLNLKSLHGRIEAAATQAKNGGDTPQAPDQYNPGATLSWD